MNSTQVDKVYVRILSVSLLLSLCSVGVVSPRLCRTIFVSEAETAFVKQACQFTSQSPIRGKSLPNGHQENSPFRRFFTSISSRLAEMCSGGKNECSVREQTSASGVLRTETNVPYANGDFAYGCCSVEPLWSQAAKCKFTGYVAPSGLTDALRIMPIRAGPIAA